MKKKLAPVVLFVYNRPWHTKQTLEALMKNELSDQSLLYIFCDGAKVEATERDFQNIKKVRKLANTKQWCKEVIIIEREENYGLAKSIISGVTQVINEHGRVIVLEDDIKTEPNFLRYMNKALDFFQNKKEVFHINGFSNESNLQFLLDEFYFLKFMNCWGWATWKDRWNRLNLNYSYFYDKIISSPILLSDFNYDNTLDFHLQLKSNVEGKIKTWAILWFSTIYLNKGLCLTPKFSLVENIGLDGSGVHCGKTDAFKKIYKRKNHDFQKHFRKIVYREKFISRWHLKMYYKYGNIFSAKKYLKSKIKTLRLGEC